MPLMNDARPYTLADLDRPWRDVDVTADRLRATVESLNTYQQELCKCYDLAQRFAAEYPTLPGVWAGTVSERLALAINTYRNKVIELMSSWEDFDAGVEHGKKMTTRRGES